MPKADTFPIFKFSGEKFEIEMDELPADRLNICLSKTPTKWRLAWKSSEHLPGNEKATIAEVNTADRMIDSKATVQQSKADAGWQRGEGRNETGPWTIYGTLKEAKERRVWLVHRLTPWEIKDVNPTRSIMQHNPLRVLPARHVHCMEMQQKLGLGKTCSSSTALSSRLGPFLVRPVVSVPRRPPNWTPGVHIAC